MGSLAGSATGTVPGSSARGGMPARIHPGTGHPRPAGRLASRTAGTRPTLGVAPVNLLIIEVPSPLGLRPDGVQSAPGALRTAGLHARLGSPDEARIDVPPYCDCLLYTSDAADDLLCVDLGGRR